MSDYEQVVRDDQNLETVLEQVHQSHRTYLLGFKDGLHNPHVEGSVELDLQFGEVEGYHGIRRPDVNDYEKKIEQLKII